MKTLTLIALAIISTQLFAFDSDEIAYLLNQEMEGLMKAAPKPKVWASGSLPSRNQRSGPAPTQMDGVENLEQRFFSDEVNFQAARSLEVQPEEDSEKKSKSSRLRARPDGTVSE
jgi:hypothetical protein